MAKKQHKDVVKELKKYVLEDDFFANLENIISRGYYPANLPPAFSSKSFASFVSNNYLSIIEIIESLDNVNTKFTKYYLARPRQIRRVLGLLNPII